MAFGNQGNDTIWGGTGEDFLDGRNETGPLYGGSENEELRMGFGNDTASYEDGDEAIYGGDKVSTGVDSDRIDLSALETGVTVKLTGDEQGTITDGID